MAICVFGYENRILASTIAAGSEVSGLSAGNLQGQQGGDATAWRTAGVTTSAGGAWFTLDFGATTTFRAFGLFRTNLTPSASVRWRVHSSAIAAGTVTTYDSGTVSAGIVAGYGQSVRYNAVDVSGRYLRCDIDDPTNPDGFISVALAYAGPVWQPSVSFSQDTALAPVRGSETTQTRSGASYVSARYYQRTMTIAHDAVKTADLWAKLMPLDRAASDGTNILFVPDPSSTTIAQESVFGLLDTVSDIGYRTLAGDWRTWRGRIAERL
jgi:hypothetical protein